MVKKKNKRTKNGEKNNIVCAYDTQQKESGKHQAWHVACGERFAEHPDHPKNEFWARGPRDLYLTVGPLG